VSHITSYILFVYGNSYYVWLILNQLIYCCTLISNLLFVFGAIVTSGSGPPHSRGFCITHDDTSQSVGLLWTINQLIAENFTWKHKTLTTDIHPPGRFRTYNLSRRAATDLHLRPRGHWERQQYLTSCKRFDNCEKWTREHLQELGRDAIQDTFSANSVIVEVVTVEILTSNIWSKRKKPAY